MSERRLYDALARTPRVTPLMVKKLSDDGLSTQEIAQRLAEPIGRAPESDFLTPACPNYPSALKETRDPPLRLFFSGRSPTEISHHRVAIVGSRNATGYGLNMARSIASRLTGLGISVCSGMALGIDGAAHRGALDAVKSSKLGGTPIAVLGHGLDHLYPRQHRLLRGQLERTGILLSEYEPHQGPTRWTFPARNRIIAGISQAVVVIEAGPKSGSLHTARFANEAGRDVWVVPNRPGTLNSQGVLGLLKDGAIPLLDVDDFLAQLTEQLQLTHPLQPIEEGSRLAPEHRRLLIALEREEGRTWRLCEILSCSPASLAAQLVELELQGFAERGHDGTWSLHHHR